MKSINQAYKRSCRLADFESTEGCITGIDDFLETWGKGDTWQEEESVPPRWYRTWLSGVWQTRVMGATLGLLPMQLSTTLSGKCQQYAMILVRPIMIYVMLTVNPKPQIRSSIKERKKKRAHMSKQGIPIPS